MLWGYWRHSRSYLRRCIKSKWIDQLTKIAAERYGDDSFFTQLHSQRATISAVCLDMRNMMSIRNREKHVRINNYRLTPAGMIDLPFSENRRLMRRCKRQTVTLLDEANGDDLISVSEVLIANLCTGSCSTSRWNAVAGRRVADRANAQTKISVSIMGHF